MAMIETKLKETEFGEIPNDWMVSTFGEVLTTFSSGATPYRGIPEYYRGKIRWISSGELNYNTIIDTIEHISEDAVKKTNLKIHQPGTFLMAITGLEAAGTRGKCAFVGKPSTTNQSCLAINGTDKMCTEYLYHFYRQWGDYLAFRYCQGTKQQSYTAAIVKSLPIIAPKSLPEQRAIADALSSVDGLIAALEKNIEKKRLIKQGTMQQLLTGKQRLKGFTDSWKYFSLNELEKEGLVKLYRGKVISKIDILNNPGNYPIYSSSILNEGEMGKYGIFMFDEELISWSIDGGGNFFYRPKHKFSITNVSGYIRVDTKYINYKFLAYVLNLLHSSLKFDYLLKAHPSVIRKIYNSIPTPQISEQRAIAQILSDMDAEINALEQKCEKMRSVKQGMMQQLLMGKIRLVETSAKKQEKSANVFFKRSVLAAEIADRLCEEPTFGHVKMEKMLFLSERLCHIDIASNYHRDAAGPYDNRALRSIDSQLKNQKWFEVVQTEKGKKYRPMSKRGGHRTYFDRYYSEVAPIFDWIINTFRTQRTEKCEIVATLYSAWEDLLRSGTSFADNDIVNEVLNNWHESKKRISKERWENALLWMRENGLEPKIY